MTSMTPAAAGQLAARHGTGILLDLDSYREGQICGATARLPLLSEPVNCQLLAGHEPGIHHTHVDAGGEDDGAWCVAVSWRGGPEPADGPSEPPGSAQSEPGAQEGAEQTGAHGDRGAPPGTGGFYHWTID